MIETKEKILKEIKKLTEEREDQLKEDFPKEPKSWIKMVLEEELRSNDSFWAINVNSLNIKLKGYELCEKEKDEEFLNDLKLLRKEINCYGDPFVLIDKLASKYNHSHQSETLSLKGSEGELISDGVEIQEDLNGKI